MNIRKLLTGAGAALLFHAAAAHATPIDTITGTYSLSTSNVIGHAPRLTENLRSPFGASSLRQTNLFTASPAGSSGTGSYGSIASETITVDFSFSDTSGGTGSLMTSAIYQAKYGGWELSCSDSGYGDTDCIDWSGAGTLPTGSVTHDVTLTDGAMLALTLYNAEDWNIAPRISGSLLDPPASVPEPGSLALFAPGLLGLVLLRRRKRVPRLAVGLL
jgi:PEP-CTERM motif